MYFRSDMAQELRDRFMKEYSKEHEGEPDGIGYSQKRIFGFSVSEVDVYNENGAALLSKPVGRYVTVNTGVLWRTDPDTFEDCAGVISDVIRSMRRRSDGPVLAVGMGNADVTADAVGPRAAKHIVATHHIRKEADTENCGLGDVAVMAPGVLAQTGIEAAEQIKAAAAATRPSLIVVIDSLAAACAETLSTSVQITDAGISPGSGVGNDRGELSESTLGVQVVAIGVPTVIDAAALYGKDGGAEGLRGFYVCPKDCDVIASVMGRLIGRAVNRMCHPGLSPGESEYI